MIIPTHYVGSSTSQSHLSCFSHPAKCTRQHLSSDLHGKLFPLAFYKALLSPFRILCVISFPQELPTRYCSVMYKQLYRHQTALNCLFVYILQPGTCTNQKSDDARKRNGEVIESFKEMALDWKVPISTNRYCNPGISEPAKIENYQHCEPSELCKVIW